MTNNVINKRGNMNGERRRKVYRPTCPWSCMLCCCRGYCPAYIRFIRKKHLKNIPQGQEENTMLREIIEAKLDQATEEQLRYIVLLLDNMIPS